LAELDAAARAFPEEVAGASLTLWSWRLFAVQEDDRSEDPSDFFVATALGPVVKDVNSLGISWRKMVDFNAERHLAKYAPSLLNPVFARSVLLAIWSAESLRLQHLTSDKQGSVLAGDFLVERGKDWRAYFESIGAPRGAALVERWAVEGSALPGKDRAAPSRL
jgi:hypothetical protein